MSKSRLGALFNTSEESHYFYDSGTGKIVSCDSSDRGIIEEILNDKVSLEEVCSRNEEFKKFIKEENLFKCPETRDFMIPTKEEF